MKLSAFSIILLVFLFYAYGDDNSPYLLKFINKDTLDALYNTGEVSSIIRQKELPVLIPEIESKKRILYEIKEMNPTIGVEILLLYKTDANPENDKKILVALYNTLQSISTLKGIEYYSASRKKMRIFYHDAYVIKSPENKIRIDDPVYDIIPKKSSLFAFLKDSSFGTYVCGVDFYFDQDSFLMEMRNMTQIWYYIVPLIDPGKLKSYTIIIPASDEILFYGFSCLSTINLFGIAESRIESLYNRIKAIYKWFQTH